MKSPKPTRRERLGRKIIRLQKLLNKWRSEWKQMPIEDAEEGNDNEN